MNINTNAEATVYTTPGCAQCNMTKRWLDRQGVNYDTVDLTQSPDDYAAVTALGYKSAPVVAVGDNVHWGGFRVDLLTLHFGDEG